MNATSDPTRATDLYRPDGRFYDLSEEGGVLSLEMRRSVRIDRAIAAGILTASWIGLYIAIVWFGRHNPDFSSVFTFTPSFGFVLPLRLGWGYIASMKRSVFWKLDQSTAQVFCGAAKTTDFSKVQKVRAWRRGRKFYLALQLRFGQTVKIGRLGFANSEYAWRHDAAQIAAFLGVPLEIPPL